MNIHTKSRFPCAAAIDFSGQMRFSGQIYADRSKKRVSRLQESHQYECGAGLDAGTDNPMQRGI